ncbi:MAG: ribosome maturation factor RimM [Bacteroidetes bacterium]|nr:ribosome maturation factor RimM [Bacteroidota bacterium]MCY4233837.1 ribosome maturation factor RimM [Bacteroidota bacterium]
MMSTSLTENLLLIGRITRPHGLKGECKIIPESDDPSRVCNLKRIWLGSSPETAKSYLIDSARLQTSKRGITVLMHIAGIDSLDDAQRIGKPKVYGHIDDLPPLEDGEYYMHDLIGVQVVSEEGDSVGTLKDVLETQAHPLYVIDRPDSSETLVPAVPEFIVSTDINQRQMIIRCIEGLIS